MNQEDIPILRRRTHFESEYVLGGNLILVTEGCHRAGKTKQEFEASLSLVGTVVYLEKQHEFVRDEELYILRRHCNLPSLVSARISQGWEVEYLTEKPSPVPLWRGATYLMPERANKLGTK